MSDKDTLVRWSLIVAGGVTALAILTLWAAEHFPQQYAREFYIAKAIVGMVAVTMAILHMDRTWDFLRSGAQMSRYIMLLFGAVVAGAGSIEQIKEGALVELRNLGGMEFLLGVIFAMAWSLREDHRRACANHSSGTP